MDKKNWIKPVITDLETLPEALGHCVSGPTFGGNICQNGTYTGTAGHKCRTGGTAGVGQCATGVSPIL